MPYPSAACGTCKIRRVKCDEIKPVCNRCSKSKRICLAPSTTKRAKFSIHLENRFASGETKRPRGPRGTLNVQPVDADLEPRALSYYLQNHVKVHPESPNTQGGLHEVIIAWQESEVHCAMVDLALSTMALGVYAQTHLHPVAAEEAAKRYHHLLGITSSQIARVGARELNENSIDSCLVAIYLMGRYEGSMHWDDDPKSFDYMHSWSHHDGAMAVLKVWSETFSHNTPSVPVKQTRRGLLRSCALRNLDVPEWMVDGQRFGETDLELDYDRLNVRLVKLRHATMHLAQGETEWTRAFLARVEDMYEEARRIDVAMEDWSSHLNSPPQEHSLQGANDYPQSHFYSAAAYTYQTPGYGAIWALYFANRILVLSLRLRLLEYSRSGPLQAFAEERARRCNVQLQTLGDSLAASVPFCLGQIRLEGEPVIVENKDVQPLHAHSTIWALSIGGSIQDIGVSQKHWFRLELAAAGRVLGTGVIANAENDNWPLL